MTNLVENNSHVTDNQEASDTFQEKERSYDLKRAAKSFKEIFDPQNQVSLDKKHALCESHIRTIQKMWLPDEYTQRQAEAYSTSMIYRDLANNQLNPVVREEYESRAQQVIREYEQELLDDPFAQEVRGEVQIALYSEIDDDYKDEFARTIGMEIPEEILEEAPAPEIVDYNDRLVASVRELGRRVVGGLVSLKTVFAK